MNKATSPSDQIKTGLEIALLVVLMGSADSCSTSGHEYYDNPLGFFGIEDHTNTDSVVIPVDFDSGSNVHEYSRRGHESRGSAHHGNASGHHDGGGARGGRR